MKKINLLWLFPLGLLAACANGEQEGVAAYLAKADTVAVAGDMSLLNSPSRKIVHEADMRCRVPDVFTAAARIEATVKELGGIVEESTVASNVHQTQTLNYKVDSLKEVQTFVTTANIVLRVPAQHLDSVLQTIPRLSTFIVHKKLKQEDLTHRFLGNVLKNDLSNNIRQDEAALTANGRNSEVVDDAVDRKEAAVDRRLQNLHIRDKVNYATLTVELFQPEQIDMQVVVNPRHASQLPISTQLLAGVRSGGELLANMLVLLVTLWPLWLFAAIGSYIYKMYKKRMRPKLTSV